MKRAARYESSRSLIAQAPLQQLHGSWGRSHRGVRTRSRCGLTLLYRNLPGGCALRPHEVPLQQVRINLLRFNWGKPAIEVTVQNGTDAPHHVGLNPGLTILDRYFDALSVLYRHH